MGRTTKQLRASSRFQGVRVSVAQEIVMAAASRAGVRFTLDSGRRTMADQRELVREKGIYNPVTNPHGAAVPNPRAPHIKALGPGGSQLANHADDVNSLDGGHLRLARFYISHGCPVFFNVSTEAWHMDPTDEGKLLATARKLDDPFRDFPAVERKRLHEWDERRGKMPKKHRAWLHGWMVKQRKAIWHAAQKSGWSKYNRRARYNALLARTT